MKFIIIIILILIFIIGIYNKDAYDKLSYEDIEDFEIIKQFSLEKPKNQINNYTFVKRDNFNIIYKNNEDDTIKIVIRGTKSMTDIMLLINYFFGFSNVNKSEKYKNTYRLLDKYKNNKIYIIGHSIGCYIAEEIIKNMKLNIVKKKYISPLLLDDNNLSDDTHIIKYKYDMVSLFIPKNKNNKTIFRNIPIESSELFFIHNLKFTRNAYKDDTLFWMNKIVIILILIILISFQ